MLVDSNPLAAAFLDDVWHLSVEFAVGLRSTRRTLHPGKVIVADDPHGGYVEEKNWPHHTLVIGRTQGGDRTLHAVSSELMDGDEVTANGGTDGSGNRSSPTASTKSVRASSRLELLLGWVSECR
ncbi:hypothetical protein [Deinococcus sp.]|uniref:hypothetical protein n=1 Tax=Deinococcus sp. TaxID=47478 RepID=UPI002869A5BB|nr:hypothetical protein [Deinococcus sp.]